jgi:aubergine-like protein
LEDWLFIYPETDEPVLDIWLRSLRDIATVAFGMKMADPKKIVCTNQRDELVHLLAERVTPKTQMVLLLTPQKNSKWVYNLLKQTTCTKLPCSTQVVKSETVRKRQSIAAVLSRIVLQINAKFCGPLWNVNLAPCAPVFVHPTMVIGIDVYHSFEQGQQEQWIGFAASLDTACTEYYSNASQLDPAATRQSMSIKLQEYTRDALLEFTERNEGLLPQHIVVYRASMSRQDWAAAYATEIEAIKLLLSSIDRSSSHCEPHDASACYQPDLTFIAISRHVGMRFFASCPNQQATKNPEPGTVIDSPLVGGLEPGSFYLINQAVGKGAASPTHYTVLYDSANLGPNILQILSYSLSFLYFNYTGSVKMPAPAHYAKKIAHFVGTAVRASPHKRLVRTFFYL